MSRNNAVSRAQENAGSDSCSQAPTNKLHVALPSVSRTRTVDMRKCGLTLARGDLRSVARLQCGSGSAAEPSAISLYHHNHKQPGNGLNARKTLAKK
jgi:hypothetical protein